MHMSHGTIVTETQDQSGMLDLLIREKIFTAYRSDIVSLRVHQEFFRKIR